LLSKNPFPTLVVQTTAFQIDSLRLRYKQLLSKSTPYAGVQKVAFEINYTGGTSPCCRYNFMLVVLTPLTLTPILSVSPMSTVFIDLL